MAGIPQNPKETRRDTLRRHRATIGTGAVLAVAAIAGVVLFAGSDGAPPPRKIPPVVMVAIQPPPPPPPPIERPIEQPKMVEQQKMEVPEFKPQEPRLKDEPPPKAPDLSGPLGLDADAEGPGDSFGLAGTPGGSGILGGGGGGSRWGWYASMVQDQVMDTLRANPKTRKMVTGGYEVRLWVDGSGRVTRARMSRSTGDPDIDSLLVNEIFPGMRLKEPPPRDMPMPIVGRGTGRRTG